MRIFLIILLIFTLSGCAIPVRVIGHDTAYYKRKDTIDRINNLLDWEKEERVLFECLLEFYNFTDNLGITRLIESIRECYKKWDKKGDFFQFACDNLKYAKFRQTYIRSCLENIKDGYRKRMNE